MKPIPNTTHYYLTNGIETYEYHAAVHSGYKLVDKVAVGRTPEEEIYACYRKLITPNVLHTTKGLKDGIMSGIRLSVIERTSPKISVRYSILVQQRTVSEDEFTYQRQLQASSEQQGSLFASTPGALLSNVRPITDPNEYVLGYFRGQEVKTFRYFIGTYSASDHEIPRDFKQPQPDTHCFPETTCLFNQLQVDQAIAFPPAH
ncbi:MAG: DUF4249 family protein [Bacteroidota bacterium]